MSSEIKTRINLRKDVLANWEEKNPVLGSGEMAIVEDGNGDLVMKIGNGISAFNQLPYLYQQEFKTGKLTAKEATVKSLSQGYNVSSTPTSLATGVFSEANGNFGVVHGIEAQILSSDDYAFVFNGTNLSSTSDRYSSHGTGTFSINPVNGLRGFYIGQRNLDQIFTDSTTKTWIKSPDDSDLSDGAYSNLSVIKLTKEDYDNQVLNDKLSESAIYFVSSEFIDAYGQQIKNVRMEDGTYEGTAATKTYVDDVIANEKNERVSSDKSFESLVADLSNQISALSLSLSDESDVRINAVSKLINDLSAESKTREEQDKILSASILSSGCSFTDDVKMALADCLENVTWKDDDAAKYRALKKLLGLPLVESISIDSITVREDLTVAANVSIAPDTIDISTLYWWSDDETIATISAGIATGVAIGTTTIWAEKDGIKASCDIQVIESGVEYPVTMTLQHCTADNTSTTIGKGSAFSCTITPDEGYKLGTITCTMGGISQTVTDGKISISAVTGDIVISASCEALTIYTITNNLTHCSTSNSATQVYEGSSYSATLTTDDGYALRTFIVTMGDVEQTVSGTTVTISSVTGNIVVTAVAEEAKYTISYNLSNCTSLNEETGVDENISYQTTIVRGQDCVISSIQCDMGGNAVSASDGYVIEIPSVTADVTIDATAVNALCVDMLCEDYAASDDSMDMERSIDFYKGDYIEAQIDCSTCKCSSGDENVFGVGTAVNNWSADCAYLFYIGSEKDLLYCVANKKGSVSRCGISLSSTTFNIKIDKSGVWIDDALLPVSSWNSQSTSTNYAKYCYDNMKNLDSVHIGAAEGQGRTNATYAYVKVVHSPLPSTARHITYILTGYTAMSPLTVVEAGHSLTGYIYRNPGYATVSQEIMFPDGTTSAYEGNVVEVLDIQTDISVRCIGQQLQYEDLSTDISSATWEISAEGLDFASGDAVEVELDLTKSAGTWWPSTWLLAFGEQIDQKGADGKLALFLNHVYQSQFSGGVTVQTNFNIWRMLASDQYSQIDLTFKDSIVTPITTFSLDARGLFINNCPDVYINPWQSNPTVSEQFSERLLSCSTLCVGRKLGTEGGDNLDIVYPCNRVRVYRSDMSKRQTQES